MVQPANAAVSVRDDLPSVTHQSVNTRHFPPSHDLLEGRRTSHHPGPSSKGQSLTTIPDSDHHLSATYSLTSLPGFHLSTNTESSFEGATPDANDTPSDGRFQQGLNIVTRQKEEPRTDVDQDEHSSTSVPSSLDSTNDKPVEASGSGSGCDSSGLDQDLDKSATVHTHFLLTSVEDTGAAEMETNNDKAGPACTEGCTTGEVIQENESELSGEGAEDRGNQTTADGQTDHGVRQLSSAAEYGSVTEVETDGEAVTQSNSHTDISSWPGGMSGSVEGSGDREEEGTGKEKLAARRYVEAAAESGVKAVLSGHEDRIKADLPTLGSGEGNRDSASVAGGNSTFEDSAEDDDHGNSGAKSDDLAEEGGKQESHAAVDGWLFDAARRPVLGSLAPGLRRAVDKPREGKCSSPLVFLSALLLCHSLS